MAKKVTEIEKVGRGERQSNLELGCCVLSLWRVTLLHVAGIWSQLWQQSRKAGSRDSEEERLALTPFIQEGQG